MPLRQGIAPDHARLYAELARDLDAHSRPRAAHGAFARFIKKLGAGPYKRYAPFRGRSVQWCRLVRDSHRAFGKGLQKLLEFYGSAKVIWGVKLMAAGQVEVDGGRLKIVKGPGRGQDLADLTSAAVDRMLAHRPLRARRRPGGPATSGRTFELPRDLEAITAFLVRRLKTLKPSRAVPVPRFTIKSPPGTSDLGAARLRSLSALTRLEGLLDLYRDLVRELKGLVLVEGAPPVMLRGQGRGERPIKGIAIERAALTKRLADVGRARRPLAVTSIADQPARKPHHRKGPRASGGSAEKRSANQGSRTRATRRRSVQ